MKPIELDNVQQTKSGSGASVTLSPITIAGSAGQPNMNISFNSSVPGGPQGGYLNSNVGTSQTYNQGANSPGSVDPTYGGLMVPQMNFSTPSPDGGFSSVSFTGYTSFTGESRLTFSSEFPLSESMEGGTITIKEPQINTDLFANLISDGANIDPFSQASYTSPIGLTGIHTLSGSYEFQITEVESTNKCRIQYLSGLVNNSDYLGNGDFQIKVKSDPGQGDGQTFINRINATTNFTSSHVEPFVTVMTDASQSFAEVIIANIEPATGDVFKMKTQYKPGGMFGEYIDLGDTVLEKTQLLIDQEAYEAVASTGVDYNRIGFFTSLIDFNNYWTTGDFPIDDENVATVTYEPDILMSGVRLTPATDFDATTARYSGMHLKTDYKVSLTKNTKYIFDLKAYATDNTISTDNTFPVPRLDIYVSGSINGIIPGIELNQWRTNPYNAQQYPQGDDFEEFNGKFGTRISTYELDPSGSLASNVQATFRANDTFDADIFFVVRRGDWSIARVNLWTHKETGFSPNYVRQNIRIPTAFLKTPLAFKFNFYDYTGTPAEAEAIAYPVTFTGENTYIDGQGNLITGSVFVGNTTAGGVEIGGANSAFIRAVGYEGYNSSLTGAGRGGFMIYSGSVIPNHLNYFSNDTYAGVGLELVADDDSGHLIFGTSPSILDIKASTFFIGTENSMFISGSSGNIEISSSLFHLDPANNILIIGADTVIKASLSADSIYVPAGTNDSNAAAYVDISGNAKFVGDKAGNYDVSFETSSARIGQWNISATDLYTSGYTAILKGGTTPAMILQKSGSSILPTEDTVRMYYDSDTAWGLSGSIEGNNIFHMGSTNQIAGWSFDDTTLTGGNLVLKKEGTIQTSDYISNVQGWTLNAASGGFLEVENAKIRGTLSTAVFEKETVNAVGGQLYIANSTTLTGSTENPYGFYSATDTTMSVANVSGFTGSYGGHGEILAAKKVHATGFGTEYMFVHSASRNVPSSDIDLSGKLYVTRGYVNNEITSSLGDLASSAQTYTGSQVIVSTGIVGTGYIRLNANPNDTTTPYMDIVERTGSGVFDMSHKARLGDLSGVSDTINGTAVTGYGLYTDNAFLKGGIVATYGLIGGWTVGTTLSATNVLLDPSTPKLTLGSKATLTDSNTGFYAGTDGIALGSSSLFKVSSAGVLNATAGDIGGFGISSTTISSSNDNLILTSDGQISASSAIFDDFIQVKAIRYKSIVITQYNKGDYFVDGATTSTLYLDGSVNLGAVVSGGPGTYPDRIASHVELQLNCNGTHVNKIIKIVPASFNDRGFAEVQLVIGGFDVKIFADANSPFAQQFGQSIVMAP